VILQFTVLGEPRPQGSMRAFMPKGHRFPIVTHTKGKRLTLWRKAVEESARQAILRADVKRSGELLAMTLSTFPVTEPVVLALQFRLKKPKIDLDKLIRAVGDALTGVVYVDDSQIVEIIASRNHHDRPSKTPQATITVRTFDDWMREEK